jgi:hypothetical protein
MRRILLPAGFAVAVGLLPLTSSPTSAAVFSVGPPSGSFVNESVCMDVEGNNPAPGTPVIAFECHAGPNQQFQLAGETIYALAGQRCLAALPTASPFSFTIVSDVCGNPASLRRFDYFINGQIEVIGAPPGTVAICIDAGNMQNFTQLTGTVCSFGDTQDWQIK